MVEYLHVSATSSQVDVGEVEYSRFTVYNEVQTTMSITTYYGKIRETNTKSTTQLAFRALDGRNIQTPSIMYNLVAPKVQC
jgi:hypothetical protein